MPTTPRGLSTRCIGRPIVPEWRSTQLRYLSSQRIRRATSLTTLRAMDRAPRWLFKMLPMSSSLAFVSSSLSCPLHLFATSVHAWKPVTLVSTTTPCGRIVPLLCIFLCLSRLWINNTALELRETRHRLAQAKHELEPFVRSGMLGRQVLYGVGASASHTADLPIRDMHVVSEKPIRTGPRPCCPGFTATGYHRLFTPSSTGGESSRPRQRRRVQP